MTRNRATPTTDKLSVKGCLGFGLLILALVIAIFAVTGAIFTWAWNSLAPVFNGPTLELAQGYILWLLICIVGGAIGKAR